LVIALSKLFSNDPIFQNCQESSLDHHTSDAAETSAPISVDEVHQPSADDAPAINDATAPEDKADASVILNMDNLESALDMIVLVRCLVYFHCISLNNNCII
jgi:hypothetical protein